MRVAVIADLQGKPDLTALLKDNPHILMTAGDNIPNLWEGGNGRQDCTKPYSKLIDAYPELFRTTSLHARAGQSRQGSPPARQLSLRKSRCTT